MCFLIVNLFFISCSGADDISPTSTEKNIHISGVVAAPTDQESITLKNSTGNDKDISGWFLGDKNSKYAYAIPQNTIIIVDETKQFNHSTIGFQINDSDETIYLSDNQKNTIDTWNN